MSIPDYQTLMLPVLRSASNGEVRIADVIERLAADFKLSETEQSQLLPSGRQSIFSNRAHWARTYLAQAGLVNNTKRGHFVITFRGKAVLEKKPGRIDKEYLARFPEFVEFLDRQNIADEVKPQSEQLTRQASGRETPDEVVRSAAGSL